MNLELANEYSSLALEQAVNDISQSTDRNKYHKYTPELRAETGRYANLHGNSAAARRFQVNESSVRRFKAMYLIASANSEATALPTMKRGRPLVLGEEFDLEVKDNIEKQRRKGAVITRLTVTAIGKAVLMKRGK